MGIFRKRISNVIELATRNSARDIEEIELLALNEEFAYHKLPETVDSHVINNIAGLELALNAKADIDHTQTIGSVTGLSAALLGKANVFSGYSGNFVVMTSPTTSKTLVINNGIITAII